MKCLTQFGRVAVAILLSFSLIACGSGSDVDENSESDPTVNPEPVPTPAPDPTPITDPEKDNQYGWFVSAPAGEYSYLPYVKYTQGEYQPELWLYSTREGIHKKISSMDLKITYGSTRPDLIVEKSANAAWPQYLTRDIYSFGNSKEVYFVNQKKIYKTSLVAGETSQVTIESNACHLTAGYEFTYLVYQTPGNDKICNTNDDLMYEITSNMTSTSIALPYDLAKARSNGAFGKKVIFANSSAQKKSRQMSLLAAASDDDILFVKQRENNESNSVVDLDVYDSKLNKISVLSHYISSPGFETFEIAAMNENMLVYSVESSSDRVFFIATKDMMKNGEVSQNTFTPPGHIPYGIYFYEDCTSLNANIYCAYKDSIRIEGAQHHRLRLFMLTSDGSIQFLDFIEPDIGYYERINFSFRESGSELWVIYSSTIKGIKAKKLDLDNFSSGVQLERNIPLNGLKNSLRDFNYPTGFLATEAIENYQYRLDFYDLETDKKTILLDAVNSIDTLGFKGSSKLKETSYEPLLMTIVTDQNTLLAHLAVDGSGKLIVLGALPEGFSIIDGNRNVDTEGNYLIGFRHSVDYYNSEIDRMEKISTTELWTFTIDVEDSLKKIKETSDPTVSYYPLRSYLDNDEVILK